MFLVGWLIMIICRVTHSECGAVPADVQSVMLLAADKRQRLHHLMNETDQEDGYGRAHTMGD